MARQLITDAQWELLQPYFETPRRSQYGRPRADARRLLDGVLWILRTGAPWRDLPEEFGNWATVYEYFSQWRAKGAFEAAQQRILLDMQAKEPADLVLWFIDSTILRATRDAGRVRSRREPVHQPRHVASQTQ